MDAETYSILKRIRNFDPNGLDVEPTENMLRAFRETIIERYGEDIWFTYSQTMWDKGGDV